ncbi:MAG: hypothetical protein LBF67_01385 [Prevotellaceae bacterium]|nr:hypothetical protein [Prevotellaceae bacterium]
MGKNKQKGNKRALAFFSVVAIVSNFSTKLCANVAHILLPSPPCFVKKLKSRERNRRLNMLTTAPFSTAGAGAALREAANDDLPSDAYCFKFLRILYCLTRKK